MMAQAKHGRLRPSLLTHRFNMRGKIAMPVPGNSRWNFARVLVSHFTPDDESKVQLNDFVDRVHNGIKKMVADCAKVQAYLGQRGSGHIARVLTTIQSKRLISQPSSS
ncbi:hypothetical protein NC651_029217 [Populus alba x Populus x berolinensis]|nr:hypothetical protein NC651_029205 [Populus alba x Populus x berolinensis]KAJ6882874.1 hypothetical protein NC651_029217 [Populus alba x Populus x berolinensis]